MAGIKMKREKLAVRQMSKIAENAVNTGKRAQGVPMLDGVVAGFDTRRPDDYLLSWAAPADGRPRLRLFDRSFRLSANQHSTRSRDFYQHSWRPLRIGTTDQTRLP